MNPCPFCSSSDVEVNREGSSEHLHFFVECNNCCAKGPTAYMFGEAISAWNKRELPLAAIFREGSNDQLTQPA